MPHVAWTLTDWSTGTAVVYTFPNNPNEFDPPKRSANITEEIAVAANGNPIIFQGRDAVKRGTFSGWMKGSTNWTNFLAEMDKAYSLQLTDDLSNSWYILIQDFTPKRHRRAIEPNYYTYNVEFLVLG